ncbi:MAG TPA: hypothetical protein VF384_04850 [Planctomycetota bacterium]
MEPREPEPAKGDPAPCEDDIALVQSLASAIKSIAIYPASHPRVAGAAAEVLRRLRTRFGHRRTIAITVHGDELVLAGERLPMEGLDTAWLAKRLRTAGLRGVEFDIDVTVNDIDEFVGLLNRCRAGVREDLLSQWQEDHGRLRPLPLVFTGHYAGADGRGDLPEGTRAKGAEPTPRDHVEAVLQRLGKDDPIRKQLQAIESQTADASAAIDRSIDLVDAIGDLLPADIANDPQQIEAVVRQVLCRVEEGLGALVQRNAKVKGGELLRMAIGVARTYFHAESPHWNLHRKHLPTGRPEDEGIVASLDQLLEELDRLPDATDLRLPPVAEFEPGSASMNSELCGVLLHTLTHSTNAAATQAAATRLCPTVSALGPSGGVLIGQYMNLREHANSIDQAARTRILRCLVDGGLETFVRAHGFIDAAFVARGFPEVLPLASRVLGQDNEGLRTMRQGLELLGTMLHLGGVAAAAKAGVLLDPVVIKALISIGGDLVLPFLPFAATHGSREVRQMLLDLARELQLPAPEVAALGSVASVDELPRDYLQNLLAAAVGKKFDAAQRAATARLLRAAVERSAGNSNRETYLAAIDNLRHVPDPETRQLLKSLATAGRFTQFGSRARAVRRHARAVLSQLAQMP